MASVFSKFCLLLWGIKLVLRQMRVHTACLSVSTDLGSRSGNLNPKISKLPLTVTRQSGILLVNVGKVVFAGIVLHQCILPQIEQVQFLRIYWTVRLIGPVLEI